MALATRQRRSFHRILLLLQFVPQFVRAFPSQALRSVLIPCKPSFCRNSPITFLWSHHGDDEEPTPHEPSVMNQDNSSDKLWSRFLSPRIDDPNLLLADAGMAQIVAPTLQVFWLGLNQAPPPSWLRPIGGSMARGSLLAPTLIHGAALAICWILGALAARSYESEAFTPSTTEHDGNNYTPILLRTIQAGCFSTGLLVLSTQLDLLAEFQRYVQPGESEEIDFRLLTALVEVINDVFFEAVTMISWRLFVARQNAPP